MSISRPGVHDDDVHAALEAFDLRLDRRAAVHGKDAELPHSMRVRVQCLGDLHRQLARRREDECLRVAPLDVDLLEDRQRERRGFSRARLSLTDEVTTCQQDGNRALLDGRRRLVSKIGECLDDGVAEA
jgi:hypothetical protein